MGYFLTTGIPIFAKAFFNSNSHMYTGPAAFMYCLATKTAKISSVSLFEILTCLEVT